jgi:hypothetical protein
LSFPAINELTKSTHSGEYFSLIFPIKPQELFFSTFLFIFPVAQIAKQSSHILSIRP